MSTPTPLPPTLSGSWLYTNIYQKSNGYNYGTGYFLTLQNSTVGVLSGTIRICSSRDDHFPSDEHFTVSGQQNGSQINFVATPDADAASHYTQFQAQGALNAKLLKLTISYPDTSKSQTTTFTLGTEEQYTSFCTTTISFEA